MKLFVNGETEGIEGMVTVLEFLKSKGIDPAKVVVEYNSEILRREEWSGTSLKENDRLEVLRFVGGG